MTDPTEIRTARADDLAQIVALYRHLHADDAPVSADALEEQWRAIVDDPRVCCIVAVEDGLIVASCTLVVVPNLTRGARPYGLIENVVTHVAFRRRGLGRRVLHHALAMAWAQRCYKVMLLTGSREESTLRFYERAGFERGVKTGFIAYPDDREHLEMTTDD